MPSGPDSDDLIFGMGDELVVSRTVRDTAAVLDVTLDGPTSGLRLMLPAPEVPYRELIKRPPRRLRIRAMERVPVVLAFGGVVGRDLDHRPVVVLGALRGRAGAHPLPHGRFDQAGGGFHGEAAAGGQGHRVVGADGQDVAGAALADALAQVTAAVDFVAGDEPGADALVVRVLQQVARPAAAWSRT